MWLRTARHPAAEVLEITGSFDHVYETADSFDDVYEAIVEHLVDEAAEHGEVVYAVPGSPNVAERTVELLRDDERVRIEVQPALSFTDLAWARLGIDPMAEAATIVDAHRFTIDAAGRIGPLLVTQVHSAEVLEDLVLAVETAPREPIVVLQGLGTAHEVVAPVRWNDLVSSVQPDHLTSLWIPRLAEPVAGAFSRFDELVRRLREECPWDRAQTHASLRRFLLEEAHEVLEAIDLVEADPESGYVELEEELGDLLFQVFIHSRLAAEEGRFTISDVADGIHDKLYSRHPHVFGDADPHHTVAQWEVAKRDEKQRESVMDGIPATLPALLYALKVQKRAAATGFSGSDLDWALGDVADELAEVAADPSAHEVGDLLYAVVQVARAVDIDPELALRSASDRFARRFRHVEAASSARGQELHELDGHLQALLWSEAKQVEASRGRPE